MVPSPEPPRPRLRAWLLAAGLSLCACEVASAAPAPERATKRAEREAKRAEREAKRAEREAKAPAPAPAPASKPATPPASKPAAPAKATPAPAALQPTAACPPGNPLTYRSYGAGFLRTWCTGCHSSTLPERERQDAPPEVNFDTHALFLPHAKEVLARTADADSPMPPAGLVPEPERRRLAQWIACGAPQPAAP